MQNDIKRLFFGIETHAPWPSHLPKGRLLEEDHRHLTLAFLGNIPFSPLKEKLNHFPKIHWKIGTVGYFDACLALPPHHPNVIAWHAQAFDNDSPLFGLQKILSEWLKMVGYSLDERPWMPHVTLCRKPFDADAWMKDFTPFPFYASSIHLYESLGNLNYMPLWSYPVKAPFEEINHTADVAFLIRGENLDQIYLHAFTAMAFKAPEVVKFFTSLSSLTHLDDVIIGLNDILSRVDREIGSPMKAVSFHGEIVPLSDGLFQWEMIIDV